MPNTQIWHSNRLTIFIKCGLKIKKIKRNTMKCSINIDTNTLQRQFLLLFLDFPPIGR